MLCFSRPGKRKASGRHGTGPLLRSFVEFGAVNGKTPCQSGPVVGIERLVATSVIHYIGSCLHFGLSTTGVEHSKLYYRLILCMYIMLPILVKLCAVGEAPAVTTVPWSNISIG